MHEHGLNDALYMLGQAIMMWIALALMETAKWLASRRTRSVTQSIHKTGMEGSTIKVLLAELGTRLNADRAFVAQFHNGDHYVSGSELLRKSRTHEWTRASVSITTDYQNILVSLVSDECHLIEEHGPSFRALSKVPQGPFHRMLEAESVIAVARCSIRYKGDIVGFVGVDYLRRSSAPGDMEQPPNIDQLMVYAARIEQVLAKSVKNYGH